MAKKISLEYCKEGKPISDFELDKWLEKLIGEFNNASSSIRVKVCNETVIERSLLLITRGVLEFNQLVFIVDGKTLHLNEFGSIIEKVPKGFLQLITDSIFERSKYAIELKKKRREGRENKNVK